MMKFFIAGVMRGSVQDDNFVDQSYRKRIKDHILNHYPSSKIFDPLEGFDKECSNEATHAKQLQIFEFEVELAQKSDVLIAYLPESSMGTGIELWEAFRKGVIVFTISPMIHNWTVKLFSHKLFATLEDFEACDLCQTMQLLQT